MSYESAVRHAFFAYTGLCELSIVHHIVWQAMRRSRPHPTAACIHIRVSQALEAFMTQAHVNGLTTWHPPDEPIWLSDATRWRWRSSGNYPVNMHLGRFLPFIADHLAGNTISFLHIKITFTGEADHHRADCGHQFRTLLLCSMCKVAVCESCAMCPYKPCCACD